jgi:hypothetical protein
MLMLSHGSCRAERAGTSGVGNQSTMRGNIQQMNGTQNSGPSQGISGLATQSAMRGNIQEVNGIKASGTSPIIWFVREGGLWNGGAGGLRSARLNLCQ